MVLRHRKALDPDEVAEQLNISRRHFYREHKIAIDALGGILWDRYAVPPSPSPPVTNAVKEQTSLDRLELLRLEAARIAHANRYARLDDVVSGVLPLLEELMRQHTLDVHQAFPDDLPGITTDRGLLRQILLSALGYLIEHTCQASIELSARVKGPKVHLSVRVEPPIGVQPTEQVEADERLSTVREMATLSNVEVLPVHAGESIVGFDLRLPAAEPVILVVDDNKDVLELFRRYLTQHHYRVVTAQTVQEALDQANQLQPHAITLDLMMPGQDGWDLLQALLNRPSTAGVPIIVCSVLKQKELALSLGATAFLGKPVTEQALLSALKALQDA
jgi:CheY-like chemotaxis protein